MKDMLSFKVVLTSVLGGRTLTYVRANSIDEARRKATDKVNAKSNGCWRTTEVKAEYPPDSYSDPWGD